MPEPTEETNAAPARTEMDLLKQKMSKFGVLGAGVVTDSLTAIAAKQALEARGDSPGFSELEAELQTIGTDKEKLKKEEIVPKELELMELEKVFKLIEDVLYRQDAAQIAVNEIAHEMAEETKDCSKKDLKKALDFKEVYLVC